VKFYEVKCFEPSYTLKKTKSKKKLARVYAYTHAYTQIREGGGKFAPGEGQNCKGQKCTEHELVLLMFFVLKCLDDLL